jgi:hypothetical protein
MSTFLCRVQYLDDSQPFNTTNFPEPTRPPKYPFLTDVPIVNQIAGVHSLLKAPLKVSSFYSYRVSFGLKAGLNQIALLILKIEDCALQIYRQNGTETEYGAYLDLEQTLEEQTEEFEQIKENDRTSILLRTQLSVRVHTCVGKDCLSSRHFFLNNALSILFRQWSLLNKQKKATVLF